MSPVRVGLIALLATLATVLVFPAIAHADVTLDVPAFAQVNYPGRLGAGNNNDFAGYGCGVTSMAMVFKYYGVDTDPRRLNTSLVAANGFSGELLYWSASSISAASGGKVSLTQNTTSVNWSTIDSDLAAGHPDIVFLKGQHYVVIVGKIGSQYYINDSYNGHKSIPFQQNILGLGTGSVTQVVVEWSL